MTATYCANGGYPRITGMRPLEKRTRYARPNARIPSSASEMTYNATSNRLYRLSMRKAFDSRLDRSREHRAIELRRVVANKNRIEADLACACQAGGECLRRRLAHEHAGDAVDDGLERSAPPESNHGPSAGLRFDRRDAEILFAGKEHGGGSSIKTADLFIADRAEELDIRSSVCRVLHQALTLGTVAGDAKRNAAEMARVDGDVDPFVRNEG